MWDAEETANLIKMVTQFSLLSLLKHTHTEINFAVASDYQIGNIYFYAARHVVAIEKTIIQVAENGSKKWNVEK